MPREQINIVKFDSGIISNPDQEDITNEAPVSSLNIDPNSEDGKLRSVETSGAAYTANGTAIPDVRIGEFIQQGTQYDLIYHDASDNHISAVTNFYAVQASRTLADLVTSNVSDETSIVVNNSEVHVGTGNGASNVPKWIGYIEHALFNGFTANDQFSGAGVDDMVGNLAGLTATTDIGFEIEITATGTPDVFRWRKNGGSYTTGVNITGSAQTLSDGVTITFDGTVGGAHDPTTGHTLNDKWYVTKYQVPTGLQAKNDKLDTGSATLSATETTGTGTKYFKTTKIYQWAYSLIYDGYQESPLIGWLSDTPSADSEYYTIVVSENTRLFQPSENNRVTGYNIYRRETEDLSTNSYGVFRKVYSITKDQDWVASADDLTFTVLDYGLTAKYSTDEPVPVGATYEEETGIASTLEDTMVNYALSCKGDGYLFTGKCYHPSIPDAEKYIFRSKGKRFSMFDWSQDFVILPAVPTAMAYYNSRLFVFTVNKIYRINPFDLVIEDEYEGMGAKGQRAAKVTPYGLFFANENGAYVIEGMTVTELSMQIKNASSASGLSWSNTIATSTIFNDYIILYEANKKCVLFIGSVFDAVNTTRVWAYHIPKKRWDYWNLGIVVVDVNSGAFNGKDGEIFLSNATQLVELFAGASRENWDWYSKEFNLNEPQLKKMWHYIDVDTAGTVVTTFGSEGVAPSTALTNTREIKSGGSWLTSKSLQTKHVGTSTAEIDSIVITLRKFIGYR